MSCSCRGSCKFIENGYSGYPRYALGYKYCATCRFSLICNEYFCPCCKTMLRHKSRHRLRETSIKNINKIYKNTVRSFDIFSMQDIVTQEEMMVSIQ